MRVIISADRTSDLPDEVQQEFTVPLVPYHIILEGKDYLDSVTITLEEIFGRFKSAGAYPLTAAVNVDEYVSFFNLIKESCGEPCEIVHITLGSSLTSSYQNCVLAAEKVGGVYPVDSCTLCSATGLMVMDACRMAKEGKSALEIKAWLHARRNNYRASFIIDSCDFLKAGGRCSSIAALATSKLRIKPCVTVDNSAQGALKVQRTYRGKMERVLKHYMRDLLKQYPNIDPSECVLATTQLNPLEDERLAMKAYLEKEGAFEKIYMATASCTIGSHCGPGTYALLFRTL